jgi:hypothetical protein
MSVFRFQDLTTRLPDTRNLTPIIIYQLVCCHSEATFSEPSLVKSLGSMMTSPNNRHG